MSTTWEDWPKPSEAHRVVHSDNDLLVAMKPSHLLVHRTDLAAHDGDNLRDRLIAEGALDHQAHPVNRIDRPTSGLVLFARHPEAHRMLAAQFMEHRAEKRYVALVRGWLHDECTVEKPLPTSHNATPKPAATRFVPIAHFEWDAAITRYPSSRFSLVGCLPSTGRYHQIRLHLRHLRHPIIGDTAHGDKPHNRYFAAHFAHRPLYLHAGYLAVDHPDGTRHHWDAPLPGDWQEVMETFGWSGADAFLRG
jgi:tRNA pseudouridine65 synthase